MPSFSEIEGWSVELINVTKSLLKLTVDLQDQNWPSIFLRNPDNASENKYHFVKLLSLKHSADDFQKVGDFEKSIKIIDKSCWSKINP